MNQKFSRFDFLMCITLKSPKFKKKLLKRQPEILPLIQVCLVLWLIKKPFQSVKELSEHTYFSQTTVRKHLAKLEEWGVVKGESWQPVRYFIADDAPPDFINRCHNDKSEYKISLFLRCIDV